MSNLFLTVLNMSLTASYVILLVTLVRLLLKKAPKYISYALWGVVAFRLVIPFSFESIFSLMPRNTNTVPIPHDIIYQVSPQINSGLKAVDSFVNKSLPVQAAGGSVNPLQIYTAIGSYIWVLGIIALLAYSLVSVLMLKRQLKSAQLIKKNIFEAGNLKTPFVLGLIKPKIYLPVGLSAVERNYVLHHEQNHIHRKDHIIKAMAFLMVSMHWFNPLVWIAFILMSTDMELSCDERVLNEINDDIKKSYASSLLSFAASRNILNGSPLAFGEGNIKGRIKNVMNYKRPRFLIIVISIIIVISVGIGLIANPKAKGTDANNTYLEPFTAEWSYDQNLGADFPFLDYASNDIVIFHGYFGLFVYDLDKQQIIRSLNLAPIDCQFTQGDNYCEVSVSADGNTVQLHPYSSENMYVYSISNNTLIEVPTMSIEDRFGGLIPIMDIVDVDKLGNCSFEAVKFSNGEFGYLEASEWTIGSLTYVRDDMVFRLFDEVAPNPTVKENEQNELIYSADVDGNGQQESIYIDKSQIDNNMPLVLSICNSSGNEIWNKGFSTSHVGWGSLFLCELDGKQYLLDYDPYMGQGYAEYKYVLFTLEGGNEKVYRSNSLEFDINGVKELNPPKMMAFANEVNELLEKSILLLSTEGDEYYFGPSTAEPFFERYSWLDLTPELYDSRDDLEMKLIKYSKYAVENNKLWEEEYFPN